MNIEIDDFPEHGMGQLQNWSYETDNLLKIGTALIAETGIAFDISDRFKLYSGIYAVYGLSDMRKNEKSSLVSYHTTSLEGKTQ
ncbi:hypothetical protein DHD08_15465 [Arenibacter sp. H213]|uniref:Uncharacterized protein n=1 Tax=Arenibacter antarcticus TaxID=2040469 RepID=A0ABW5VLH8_9FLAO|nr:hypothetical protein [Arenibacter sp. H213]MCM4169084.1 hypothetical protein [Arenibacter sp. H213]